VTLGSFRLAKQVFAYSAYKQSQQSRNCVFNKKAEIELALYN